MPTRKKTVTRKSPRRAKVAETPVVEETPHVEVALPAVVLEAPHLVGTVDSNTIDVYKQPALLVLLTLFLGWTFDFLFWGHPVGANYAVFMVLCLLGGLGWLLHKGLKPAQGSLWLLLPLMFFCVVTFLREEPLTVFLGFALSLVCAALFSMSYLGGRWYEYGLFDYVRKSAVLLSEIFLGGILYLTKAQEIETDAGAAKKAFPVWGVLRGLLFALPIVLCFGSLLAAGDLVFQSKLDDFFALDDLGENIFRGILIVFYAYILIGLFANAALHSKDDTLSGDGKPLVSKFMGFPETVVILASVCLLFLSFVIVQFQYFFGGETNIGVAGYTYSQYARRGFNELITVAFFSLVLVLGLSALSRRETAAQRRVYSGLSFVVVALVLVILVSAFQRISLSIGWHGYSRLRLYPQIFLVWLGALFLAVVILEFLGKERYFAFAALMASLGFAVSLTLMNVDVAIVEHNIPRTLKGKNLNVGHLASLSTDAIPALVNAYRSDAYSQHVHEGIGAILTCYLYYDSQSETDQLDWRSFNWSRRNAYTALDQIEASLQDYSIKDDDYPLKIKTPSNVLYECRERAVNED